MPIDTLKAARRLQEEGTFNEEQAERIAEVLSEMDVASATKEDLNELEDRLTARIDRLSDRVDGLETHIDEKVPTKSEMKAIKNELSKKIEEKHTATVRTVVMTMGVMTAVLAVLVTLGIFFLG